MSRVLPQPLPAHHHLGSQFFPLRSKVSVSFTPLLERLRVDDPVDNQFSLPPKRAAARAAPDWEAYALCSGAAKVR